MKKLTLFLIPLLVLLTACQKEGPIYYKASGEGYVYSLSTKKPVPFGSVGVINYSNSSGFGSHPNVEHYSTNENGFYRVRFIKRYNSVTAIYKGSEVCVSGYDGDGNSVYFDKDFLEKQKKTFKIDTLWQREF